MSLALVLVIATEGSSYSKAGQPLLVDETGEIQGLLSGGCLEADLTQRCIDAIEKTATVVIDYDLRDDDAVFGLAVGCDGAMQVLLQPLTPNNGYEPLQSALNTLQRKQYVDIEIVGADDTAPLRWVRPASLLVLGAGPDADSLLAICNSMGWSVTVNDHRPAWAARAERAGTAAVHSVAAEAVSESLDLSTFDGAVVMSHNLDADRTYLEQLAASDVPYIGLLGPPKRRDRLLEECPDVRERLAGRLHSPVGKRIGGRGPAAIALEIATELQEWFCAADKRIARASRSDCISMSTAAGSNGTTSIE